MQIIHVNCIEKFTIQSKMIKDNHIFKNHPDKLSQLVALDLDAVDPLRHLRSQFNIPTLNLDRKPKEILYFNGNSLGCQPKSVLNNLNKVVEDWANTGLGMHFTPSAFPAISCDEQRNESISKIVGARFPSLEVIAMNGLSVNLHLFLTSFYRPTGQQKKILLEKGAFPSDHYAVESQIRLHGNTPSENMILLTGDQNEGFFISTEKIVSVIEENKDQLALILLPGVQYKTGQFFDIKTITEKAHEHNIKIGWDLAHAVGNVPLKLHDWNVDFAVWCNYKYMNSGAGAIGGAFLHKKYAEEWDLLRMYGWWGHKRETRFVMDNILDSELGVNSFRLCNPPPLLIAALSSSLDIFDQTSMSDIRKKSILITGYLEFLLDQNFEKDTLKIMTTADPESRGAQLSIRFDRNKFPENMEERLSEEGVLCDARDTIIRIAPAPLYNTYSDVWKFVDTLKRIFVTKLKK